MVATRKSLPSASTDLPAGNEAEVPRELRMLHIDGKSTMRGEAPQPADQTRPQVYHWRGAVYAVTADTPKEWLDREPERVRRQSTPRDKSKMSEQKKAVDVPSSGLMLPPPSRGSKRKSTSMLEDTVVDRGAELPRANGAVQQAKDNMARIPRRLRSLTTAPPRPNPRRSTRQSAVQVEDEDMEPAGEYDASKFRFNAITNQAIKAELQEKKEQARGKGYAVEPLTLPQAAPIGKLLTANVVEMATINTKIDKLSERYANLKAHMAAVRKIRANEAQPANDQPNKETDDRTSAMNGTATVMPMVNAPSTNDEAAHNALFNHFDVDVGSDYQVDNPAASSEGSLQNSVPSINGQPNSDSSNTTEPVSITTENTADINPQDYVIGRGFPNLPATNRGGHSLRWSLFQATTGEDDGGKDGPPMGKAQLELHKSRLEGESRHARRRRVAREKKLLESLPILQKP